MTVKKVLVSASPKAPRDNSVVETPAGKEDLKVIVLPKWKQALIRTARTYLQNLLGGLTNAGVFAIGGVAILPEDIQASARQMMSALEFYQVFLIAASGALAPAVWTFLQNMIELLREYENPEYRA